MGRGAAVSSRLVPPVSRQPNGPRKELAGGETDGKEAASPPPGLGLVHQSSPLGLFRPQTFTTEDGAVVTGAIDGVGRARQSGDVAHLSALAQVSRPVSCQGPSVCLSVCLRATRTVCCQLPMLCTSKRLGERQKTAPLFNLLAFRTEAGELSWNKCMLGLVSGAKLEKLLSQYWTQLSPDSRWLAQPSIGSILS